MLIQPIEKPFCFRHWIALELVPDFPHCLNVSGIILFKLLPLLRIILREIVAAFNVGLAKQVDQLIAGFKLGQFDPKSGTGLFQGLR